MVDGGEGGWLIRDSYQPIDCVPFIKLVARETRPYIPLVLLSNIPWVRGVPTCTVPYNTLSLLLGTYSSIVLQKKSSASIFFSPYSSDS